MVIVGPPREETLRFGGTRLRSGRCGIVRLLGLLSYNVSTAQEQDANEQGDEFSTALKTIP